MPKTEEEYRRTQKDIASLLPYVQRQNLARFQVEEAKAKAEGLRTKARRRAKSQAEETDCIGCIGSSGKSGD